MKIIYIFIIGLLFVPNIAIAKDFIPYLDNRITNNPPLICIYRSDIERFGDRHIIHNTIFAIHEWINKLNKATHNNKWNVKILLINNTDKFCDISITYGKINNIGTSGYTKSKDNQSIIVISTSILLSNNVWYEREPQFIENTIKHELGHAFGLGHLQTPNDSVKYGEESIMYYSFDEFNFDPKIQIQKSDINAVINLYGNNGWNNNHITYDAGYFVETNK